MTEPFRHPDVAPADDPFYWGTRLCYVETPQGRRLEEIPLTREDILDPQEGDSMVQNSLHSRMTYQLLAMLDYWFARPGQDKSVLSDVKVLWGVPGLKEPAPDVTVIPVRLDPEKRLSSYAVGQDGPLPCLVIEVASERYADIDYSEKVELYDQAGVAEYLIIDLDQRPVALTGLRRGPGERYRASRSQRRWLSRTTGLLFSADASRVRVNVHDMATGEHLLVSQELDAARRAEAVARQVAEARAEAEAVTRRPKRQRGKPQKNGLRRSRQSLSDCAGVLASDRYACLIPGALIPVASQSFLASSVERSASPAPLSPPSM